MEKWFYFVGFTKRPKESFPIELAEYAMSTILLDYLHSPSGRVLYYRDAIVLLQR